MIVEIRNVGFVNKGAELMLYSILEKMREFFPDAKFAMSPTKTISETPFLLRAEQGLLQKIDVGRTGWNRIFNMAPNNTRKMYGMVKESEIDVILDSSGFAYGDQWGTRTICEFASKCKKFKVRGGKVILLPQSFGPFSSKILKKSIKTILDNSELIFARDRISYNYLIQIAGNSEKIKCSPDFTNLINAILPNNVENFKEKICIVPNYQMVKKNSEEKGKKYIEFMVNCLVYLLEKKHHPFFLIHGGEKDLKIVREIEKGLQSQLPVFSEDNPLKTKGIIGGCLGLIGSRFHALVGSLSQGIPTLAVGWSHKYEMLFEDYGFSEGILDISDKKEIIIKKIDLMTNKHKAEEIRKKLLNKTEENKVKTINMWNDVKKVLIKE